MDTFLTALYVMADDFCQSRRPKKRPGPEASLSESELITLAVFARWGRFASERDFYRYAADHLADAFPTLPDRSQFNRLTRSFTRSIEEFALHLAEASLAEHRQCPYEALDCSATPVRDCKRRGDLGGLPVTRTSDGPTASDGTRASACSPPSPPPA